MLELRPLAKKPDSLPASCPPTERKIRGRRPRRQLLPRKAILWSRFSETSCLSSNLVVKLRNLFCANALLIFELFRHVVFEPHEQQKRKYDRPNQGRQPERDP